MAATLILVGDVNLMNVDDPAAPFARVGEAFAGADAIFGNLECLLYDPPDGHSVEQEGFFADPAIAGEALKLAGFAAVGLANNVNYGAAAILGSIARLDRLGIAHTGAGANLAAARAPAIVERAGLRIGFVQRSSVYWPTNHEAGENSAGIAALRAHTAYQVPAHKTRPEIPPMNRPGIPPIVVTWPDRAYLAELRRRHRRVAADGRYRRRLMPLGARRGGARLHGGDRARRDRCRRRYRHRPRPALFAAGRGLQGQADLLRARQLLVPYRAWRPPPRRLDRHDGAGRGRSRTAWPDASFRFVRHNDANETVLCPLAAESETLARHHRASARLGTRV